MNIKISVISIGDELLRGQTTNTNFSFLGKMFYKEGWQIAAEYCVPDQVDALLPTLRHCWENSHVVVTIGGLGATSDDVSKQCVAQCLGKACYVDEDECQFITQKLLRRNYPVNTEFVRTQATLIRDCQSIPNDNGLASGLWFESENKILVMLPGPPSEFMRMTEEQVLPRLKSRFGSEFVSRVLHLAGIGESSVAEKTEQLMVKFPMIRPSYCAEPRQVRLTLCATNEFESELDAAACECHALFKDYCLPTGCENLAQAIAWCLTQLHFTMATAESCTGGLIAKFLTDEAGSSVWFHGSYVTYDNSWKQRCLGVEKECLENFGAVSNETASAMISGLLTTGHVQAGIAVTGIAGPGGGSDEKPVGTVYIATGVQNELVVNRYQFRGDREHIRYLTAMNALLQLYQQLYPLVSLH